MRDKRTPKNVCGEATLPAESPSIFLDTWRATEARSAEWKKKGLPSSRKTQSQRRKRWHSIGTTEEWLSRDDITVALYLRSTQRHVLLQEYTRTVI